MSKEVRWKLRFANFEKAFNRLINAIKQVENDSDNELLQAGLVQTYEFTFELAWKTLKDYLEEEGYDVSSPRKTIKQAFQSGYIKDGDIWIKSLDDRNIIAHVYDEAVANEVSADIQGKYQFMLRDLYHFLKKEL